MIPSSVQVGEIARVLREGYDMGRPNDGIQAVSRALALDCLFIDTHPGVNEEMLLSIAICDRFLLIMRPDSQDFQGTAVTGERAIQSEYIKDVLSIMLSCGMYDYAGEWAYRVGLPAKSGVGGGIVVVVPGQVGIGIFSPPLDVKGNSVRGVQVCRELSDRFGLNVFEAGHEGPLLKDQFQPRRG